MQSDDNKRPRESGRPKRHGEVSRIAVLLPIDVKEKFQYFCDRNGYTLSTKIRSLIEHCLEKNEEITV